MGWIPTPYNKYVYNKSCNDRVGCDMVWCIWQVTGWKLGLGMAEEPTEENAAEEDATEEDIDVDADDVDEDSDEDGEGKEKKGGKV